MAEVLQKLSPHRTLYMSAFGGNGCMAAIHHASSDGFQVTGNFRDNADWVQLVFYDADDGLNHPRLRWLPDYDFSGVTLQFDLRTTNCQNLDSPKYDWHDWRNLMVEGPDFSLTRIPMWENATVVDGAYTAASATFTIACDGTWNYNANDRVYLIYQNIGFNWAPSDDHENNVGLAALHLAAQMNRADWATYGTQFGLLGTVESSNTRASTLRVTAARYGRVTCDLNGRVTWISGTKFMGLQAGDPFWLEAMGNDLPTTIKSVEGATSLVLNDVPASEMESNYLAPRPGRDGNLVTLYGISNGTKVYWESVFPGSPVAERLQGGNSDVTWRIRAALPAQARRVFLHLSAQRPEYARFTDKEFSATFSNWTVEDPNGIRALRVASTRSLWIEDHDARVVPGAGWERLYSDFGNYSQGTCLRSVTAGSTITVRYTCPFQHDVYLGSYVREDYGTVEATLDGGPAVEVSLQSPGQWWSAVRRRLFAAVPAGEHVVTIRHSSGTELLFDFLQCVEPVAEIPEPATGLTGCYAATDWDTSQTLNVPPQRWVWQSERLGFTGPADHYMGIALWHHRRRVGGVFPTWKVWFSDRATWNNLDIIDLSFGGGATPVHIAKTVLPGDTNDTLRDHFVYAINESLTAVCCWTDTDPADGVTKLYMQPLSPGWNFDGVATTRRDDGNAAGGTVYTDGDLKFNNELRTVLVAKAYGGGPIEITMDGPHPYQAGDTIWIKNNPLVSREQDPGIADAIFPIYDVTPTTFKLLGSAGHGEEGGGTAEEVLDGLWQIDDTVMPPLNAAAREWHANLFSELAAAGREIAVAYSMEFTNAPDDPTDPAHVWIARYANGRRVKTGWSSHHCAFSAAVLAYQKEAFAEMANLMAKAGLVPWIQFGEFLYWPKSNYADYQTPGDVGGMAFYDGYTTWLAQQQLGRPLWVFRLPTDDPTEHPEDSAFLRSRILEHVTALKQHVLGVVPSTKFEILWALDAEMGPPLGYAGALIEYVSTPDAWRSKGLFDRFKVECLDRSAYTHDVDILRSAVAWPFTEPGWSWDKADCAYLAANWNGGCLWRQEIDLARQAGVPLVGVWAFDHFVNSSWPVDPWTFKPSGYLL